MGGGGRKRRSGEGSRRDTGNIEGSGRDCEEREGMKHAEVKGGRKRKRFKLRRSQSGTRRKRRERGRKEPDAEHPGGMRGDAGGEAGAGRGCVAVLSVRGTTRAGGQGAGRKEGPKRGPEEEELGKKGKRASGEMDECRRGKKR